MSKLIGITKNGIQENCTVTNGNCTRHYRHITDGKPISNHQLKLISDVINAGNTSERFTDSTGAVINIHSSGDCGGQYCSIHNPSSHALNEAPLVWRGDRSMMERVCKHGVGHPDADDVSYNVGILGKDETTYSAHGCDGCCGTVMPEPSTATASSKVATEQSLLPWTGMQLSEARSKLSSLHFAKEGLTDSEREILYIAEGLLRRVDEINDESKAGKLKNAEQSNPMWKCGNCDYPLAGGVGKYSRCKICGNEDDWQLNT